MSHTFTPLHHQPPLPARRLLLRDAPDEEAVPMDVLFVGGGPAGLAGAIELARLVREGNARGDGPGEIEIGVLEKAEELGQHSLSGAVVNPRAFREMFPDLPVEDLPLRGAVGHERVYFLTEGGRWRLPVPPPMHNKGNHVASLCEIVRWLGAQAEGLGVHVFTGFPAEALLLDGDRAVGARRRRACGGTAPPGRATRRRPTSRPASSRWPRARGAP